MRVYSFNLGIGWASSGVEYAQAYRSHLLADLGIDSHFVFFDVITNGNILEMAKSVGYHLDSVEWVYASLCDRKLSLQGISFDQIIDYYGLYDLEQEESPQGTLRINLDNDGNYFLCHFDKNSDSTFRIVEIFNQGILVRKDFFSGCLLFSEYYSLRQGESVLSRRVFLSSEGNTIFEEVPVGDDFVYFFKKSGLVLSSKSELIRYYLKTLQLSASDTVILDRASGLGQEVFRNISNASLIVSIHAEHFTILDGELLWNNYYEYQFDNHSKVSRFMCSTAQQAEVLRKQFSEQGIQTSVWVVPAGYVNSVSYNGYHGHSIVTASRLSSEKNLDIAIKAVVQARQVIPDLTFTIYGEGRERSNLLALIKENSAEDYIYLKEQSNQLLEHFKEHSLYLSASQSEGFGLTLLEASSVGLGIVGFDVPYGNQVFIRDGSNGYLAGSRLDEKALAEKVIEYFKHYDAQPAQVAQGSNNIAKAYLSTSVSKALSNTLGV